MTGTYCKHTLVIAQHVLQLSIEEEQGPFAMRSQTMTTCNSRRHPNRDLVSTLHTWGITLSAQTHKQA